MEIKSKVLRGYLKHAYDLGCISGGGQDRLRDEPYIKLSKAMVDSIVSDIKLLSKPKNAK